MLCEWVQQSEYWVDLKPSVGGICNQVSGGGIPPQDVATTRSYGLQTDADGGLSTVWSQFRGAGGVNPSIPPSQLQQEANTWVQTQINSGHWVDVVKPALNNAIRAGRNPRDMATLGTTGNPPFDGNPGQVGMAGAGVMNKMNTLASRIIGPPSFDRAQDEANRDWIRSTRLRWNLTRNGFEQVPN